MTTWAEHHHARYIEGCQWCEFESGHPPIDDMPWVYGPRERTWFDEAGTLRHARPGRHSPVLP